MLFALLMLTSSLSATTPTTFDHVPLAAALQAPSSVAGVAPAAPMLVPTPAVRDADGALRVPSRYAWIYDEGRSLWYAAGSSVGVAAVMHLVVGLPTYAISVSALAPLLLNPVGAVGVAAGILVGYLVIESMVAATVSHFVFNASSRAYESQWAAAFAGHLLGSAVGLAPGALLLGGAMMTYVGVAQLSVFSGQAALQTVLVLTALGATPSGLIALAALLVAPAIVGVWTQGVAALPRPGYAVDVDWANPKAPTYAPVVSQQQHAPTQTIATIALP
jgi:hypothetical protein